MENFETLLELSDIELVILAKTNPLAEEIMIKRYRALTFKVARKFFLIGGDIDDLLQEGTLGLWKAIKEFDQIKNCSFFTFAKLCITTKIMDAIKLTQALNRKYQTTAISINNDDSIIDIPSADNLLEDFLERENFENFYFQCKKILTALQFDVIKLYLEGYSYQEISEKLTVSTKKIDNELFSAKNKIKKFKDKFLI